MASPSSNFKDPIGLLLRMLSSGNRAAYAALFREGLGIAAQPFDLLMAGYERRNCRRATPSQYPQLLIIGAPRSGTTLVYQVLAQYLNVTFPTNFSAMFPRSTLSASRLLNLLPALKVSDFQNFYGQTTHLRGPNDAFHIWDRWLGTDRYQPTTEFSAEVLADMQSFFCSWTNSFRKPFLNKNNRNTSCISLLAKSLPNARFIVIKRDPLAVVQSLIRAREDVQGTKLVGWGLQSTSTETVADSLAYVTDVCRQVTSIEHDLQLQLQTIDSSRVFEITYEEFCRNAQSTLRHLTEIFPGVQLNPCVSLKDLQPFKVSSRMNLTSEEERRARRDLERDFATLEPVCV